MSPLAQRPAAAGSARRSIAAGGAGGGSSLLGRAEREARQQKYNITIANCGSNEKRALNFRAIKMV